MLVSSHVLHEVQSLTPNIILLNHGRLVAEGHVRQIRDLIDTHPHHIVLVCDDCRKLAGTHPRLGRRGRSARAAAGAGVDGRNAQARRVLWSLARVSLEEGMEIKEVYSDDDSLESVFKYLVNK